MVIMKCFNNWSSDTNNIYYRRSFEVRRVTRLIMEALEVGFFCCNYHTNDYPLAKIFDIVNYIMPTAYIVNTGYWIYYASKNQTPLCVCSRFGFYCNHKSNSTHWVNLTGSPEIRLTPFSTNVIGKYIPLVIIGVLLSKGVNPTLLCLRACCKQNKMHKIVFKFYCSLNKINLVCIFLIFCTFSMVYTKKEKSHRSTLSPRASDHPLSYYFGTHYKTIMGHYCINIFPNIEIISISNI
ncbi:hypothetical protein RI129_008247 [Pyrocoelia pectoralis]|uniref:Uncharacterized protein n=1 Tax=Pyrocoelia pectoralis TaxID=417401 RepID=A0AAN7ZDH7_9COLE